MKLQIEADSLRWRINEGELAQLLDTNALTVTTAVGGADGLVLGLHCSNHTQARLLISPGHWVLHVPRTALAAHVQRLPCCDALKLPLAEQPGLDVSFEVDVRDSMRQRGPRKRD